MSVETRRISVVVNGEVHERDVPQRRLLVDFLRHDLRLTGTHIGCGHGVCGACTVLIEGTARRSCITRVGTVADKRITTIEGMASGDRLHPLQQAFLDEGAMQCAYCTSGMIMSAASLLNGNPNPSLSDILDSMEGNVCRCGTQPRILAAIQKAARAQKGAGQ